MRYDFSNENLPIMKKLLICSIALLMMQSGISQNIGFIEIASPFEVIHG
jgi:hypothetical protein